MAWTTRADRFNASLGKSSKIPDTLGPGAYLGHIDYKADPHYAPFGSSQDNKDKLPRDTGPAPGAYDPKLPSAYDSGLPKKHVPFTVGASRLNDRAPKELGPGPGAYQVVPKVQEALSCRTMGVPPTEQQTMRKASSAPSIPQNHQSYGYEEAGDGRLVRQGPKGVAVFHSGKTGDTVGPGHYEFQAGATARRATQGKMLGAGDRSGAKPSLDTPGPGHYDYTDSKLKPVYSCFASQSDARAKSRAEKLQQPGPGSYDSSGLSRPNLREMHPELQYFGSTTERFGEAGSSSSRAAPGPGYYQAKQRPKNKSDWANGDRFAGPEKMLTTAPGPGAYDPTGHENRSSGPLGTVSILGSTGSLAFGSMASKRMIGGREQAPGPGAYDPDLGIGGEERAFASTSGHPGDGGRRRSTLRRPTRSQSAVFKSETPGDVLIRRAVKEGLSRPPPGAYDPVHARDAGTVMRQPPKSEGFGSMEPRDKNDIAKKPALAPGPGRYDAPIEITGGKKTGTFNRVVIEGAPSGGRPKGLGFECQTQRFKGLSRKTPGPGAYETMPSLISKTHNIHFGDVG